MHSAIPAWKLRAVGCCPGGGPQPQRGSSLVGETLTLPRGPLLDLQTLVSAGRLHGGDKREMVLCVLFKGLLLFLKLFEDGTSGEMEAWRYCMVKGQCFWLFSQLIITPHFTRKG